MDGWMGENPWPWYETFSIVGIDMKQDGNHQQVYNQARNNSILKFYWLISSPFHTVLGQIATHVSSKVMSTCRIFLSISMPRSWQHHPRWAVNPACWGFVWLANMSLGIETAWKNWTNRTKYIGRFCHWTPSSCGIFSISKFHFFTALGSKPPSLLAQS